MKAARLSIGFFSVVLGMVGPAGAEPPATPAAKPESAPQHVTAPSLPGQPNREGTVKPDAGMPMDSEGYAITKRYEPGSAPAKPAPQADSKAGSTTAGAAASAPAPVPNIPIGPAPTGKGMVTGANYVTVRGTLVALEDGKSVTIKLQKTGTKNTYALAPGATVDKSVSPGQLVRVRVLAAQKGKVADKVEIVPPPSPAPAKTEGIR
jgi:hypothetical protein